MNLGHHRDVTGVTVSRIGIDPANLQGAVQAGYIDSDSPFRCLVTVPDEKLILVSRELKLSEMSLLLTPMRGRCQSCETKAALLSYLCLVQKEATL